jgi:hypothetical protein
MALQLAHSSGSAALPRTWLQHCRSALSIQLQRPPSGRVGVDKALALVAEAAASVQHTAGLGGARQVADDLLLARHQHHLAKLASLQGLEDDRGVGREGLSRDEPRSCWEGHKPAARCTASAFKAAICRAWGGRGDVEARDKEQSCTRQQAGASSGAAAALGSKGCSWLQAPHTSRYVLVCTGMCMAHVVQGCGGCICCGHSLLCGVILG